MTFAGRQWDDDSKTVSECNITNFNSITVFRKLRGGGKGIKKEQKLKHQRLELADMAVKLMKHAAKNTVIEQTRQSIVTFMTDVESSDKVILKWLEKQDTPSLVKLMSALNTNNPEHKMKAIASAIFSKEWGIIDEYCDQLNHAKECMDNTVAFAFTKEWASEAGTYNFKGFNEAFGKIFDQKLGASADDVLKAGTILAKPVWGQAANPCQTCLGASCQTCLGALLPNLFGGQFWVQKRKNQQTCLGATLAKHLWQVSFGTMNLD